MSKKYVQTLTQYLAGNGVIIGATSVTFQSLTDIYGVAITNISQFGDKAYITFEPDTTNEEAATATSVTVNANGTVTLGGLSTVLGQSPYTETPGLVRAHSGGTKVVVTDNVAFWNTFANKTNNEVITGLWTAPVGGTGAQIATATDIANAITGASGTATNLVAGTTKLSVAAVSAPNPIAVGDNDTRVPTTSQTAALVGNNVDIAIGSGNKVVTQTGLIHGAEKYATTTGSANAYVATLSPVPTSLTAGMTLTLIANFSNTGASTLAVNSLGSTPAITKNGTAALISGDIVNGQAFTVVWDGTRWQLQTPTSNTPVATPIFKNGQTTYDVSTASGTQNISHGLGIIPKYIRITARCIGDATAGNTVFSDGVYNGTTASDVWLGNTSGTSNSAAGGDIGSIIDLQLASGQRQLASVTFDATNIILTWVKAGSPTGTAYLMWEAYA